MGIFKRDRNVIQSIAFMAIMAAVNVAIVLLTTIVPFLFFLCIFVLPLSSLIVTITCKKYLVPVFILSTIGICLVATLWDMSNTFLYVMPSLISGALFGLILEKNFPSILLIFIPALIYFGFTYLAFPIINAIYKIDIIETFIKSLGLTEKPMIYDIVPAFVYFISIVQSIFAYIIIKGEAPKMQIEIKRGKYNYWFCLIISTLFLITMIVTAFFALKVALLFMLMFMTFAIECIIEKSLPFNKWVIIINSISLIIGVLVVAIFFQKLPYKYGTLLFSSLFIFSLLFSFVKTLLTKKKSIQ